MKVLEAILATVVAMSVLAGCAGRKDEAPEGVEVYCFDDAEEREDLSEVFSSVELIPLEFAGEHYPQNFAKLQVTDSLILVFDQKNTLTVFENNGKYLSSSAEKYGQGPEEFSLCLGFGWNPYSNLIEILGFQKIMFYDKEFNFVRSCNSPNQAGERIIEDIFDLSPTRHVLLHNGIGNKRYRIFLFDSVKGEILLEKDYQDLTIGGGSSAQQKRFFRMPDGATYCLPIKVTDKILRLAPDSLKFENAVTFLPGENSVTPEEFDAMFASGNVRNKLNDIDKEAPWQKMFNSKKIFDTVSRGARIFNNSTYVVDRQSGEMKKYRMYDEKKLIFPEISDIDEEYAYSVIEKEDLAELPKLLLDKSEKADSILSTIEDESLIVLKYKIRD